MKRLLVISGRVGLVLLALVVVGALVLVILPRGPRDPMSYVDRTRQPRTMLTAHSFAAVTGTPWATDAALEMLRAGGNAADAAVAALLALNVTHGEASSFAGVAPTLFYDASLHAVKSYIGAGTAPRAATLEAFKARGFRDVPEMNIWSQLVPASPDVMISLLEDCGTMSFGQVAAPAIRLAREGFPVHAVLYENMRLSLLKRLGLSVLLPYNAQVYLRGQWWRPLYLHDRMRFPDLAATFEAMAAAEKKVQGSGGPRQAGLRAVRDYFYKGPIAEKIVALHKAKKGLITAADLAGYKGGWEKPVQGSYGEYVFYGNGTWSQGIMEPLILQILEGIDLKSMGRNSPQYIHTLVQAMDLAMADRDAYVGDPAFVKVPLDVLLSKEYAASRRSRMTGKAFWRLPAAGDVVGFAPAAAHAFQDLAAQPGARTFRDRLAQVPFLAGAGFSIGQDTSQLVVLDRQGNAVVITPSDFPKTPMVPGTGINLGNRMNQFRLDPASPNALAPGKRPRITPHAVIVLKNGKLFMAFSTPGGDVQSQSLVQVFLNVAVFGMNIQEAISAPRFYSASAPSSFAPNPSFPGHIRLEADLYREVSGGLEALGYVPDREPAWDKDFGAVGAIIAEPDGGISAGADPREETTAGGD